MRRKNTSAPSDWNRSLPRVGLAPVPALTTLPLRMLVIRSPSQTHSRVFHWPTGFSTSCAPRKPTTSFQAGSRPYQLMRPPLNRVGEAAVGGGDHVAGFLVLARGPGMVVEVGRVLAVERLGGRGAGAAPGLVRGQPAAHAARHAACDVPAFHG